MKNKIAPRALLIKPLNKEYSLIFKRTRAKPINKSIDENIKNFNEIKKKEKEKSIRKAIIILTNHKMNKNNNVLKYKIKCITLTFSLRRIKNGIKVPIK